MDFLAATMLWGAAAASIPVLIHLTGRARPVVHRFPALRFVVRSQRSSSRALRLKHLLLLLLRMAGIALLALALARPLWPVGNAATGAAAELRGEFVLVLDASLSMSFREREATRFERAREQALALLARLTPESRVAFLRAGEEAEGLQGRLTLHQELVRDLIRKVQPSATRLDLARALSAARAVLDREPPGELPRFVVLFTDLQATAYQGLRERLASSAPAAGDAAPRLLVVDTGSEGARNGAVLAARLPVTNVAAHQPVMLSARIRVSDPSRTAPVDLYVDDRQIAQRAVDPHGAEIVEVEIPFQAGGPGQHSARVELGLGDGLPLDQARSLTYLAGKPPRALVLEQPGPPPGAARTGPAARGSAFFIRAALESPSASTATGLLASVESAAEFAPGKLSQHQVVVLADAGDLGAAEWEALSAFVEEGGGLFVWLGPRTDPAAARRHAFSEIAPHFGLLPGSIQTTVRLESGKATGLRVALPDHPLLGRFTPGVLSALRDTRVQTYTKVAAEVKDPALCVVVETTEGAPMLLEKSYGRGRVLLAALGPELESSDLPKRGEVFVTLLLEACRILAGRADDTPARLGRPLTVTLPDPPDDGLLRYKPPDGAEVLLHADPPAPAAAGEPTPVRRATTLTVPRLDAPGLHRLTWTAQDRSPRTLAFAANPDPEESDLARVSSEEAVRALAPWNATVARDAEWLERLVSAPGAGREFPVPLLLGVLALLLVESFLSNRLYRTVETEEEGTQN